MGLLSIIGTAILCTSAQAVDGDTLRCRNLGTVRLLAIDAPELSGHCRQGRVCTPGDGDASRASLTRLIAGRRVICTPSGRDRYGRILATCTAGGRDLSCSQVRYGFAVERYGRPRCER